MTGQMWIERREGRGVVRFAVVEQGADRATHTVVQAELWDGVDVHWPAISDRRPALAMMLGHALQFAAIEAQTGETARVFLNGGHFAPRGLEVSV